MTLQELQNKISMIKKGTFVKFEIETEPKKKAAFKNDTIKKYTKMVARFGISYGNMATHKDKIVGSLPYGEWVKGYEGYIIETNGNYQLRFYTSAVKSRETIYTFNGKPTTKEWLDQNNVLQKSSSNPNNDTFNVKIENIISIGAH